MTIAGLTRPCLLRFAEPGAPGPAWGWWDGADTRRVRGSLADLLAKGDAWRDLVTDEVIAAGRVMLLAPLDHQPVWASGVTYERSLEARLEESDGERLYQDVYDAERPELFLKALPGTAVGHGAGIGVRVDSRWNTPEPEVALVVDRWGAVFGVTLGNDVSSRSIEGANALYLPQAKLYDRSCQLGPGIVPFGELAGAPVEVEITAVRDGVTAYAASMSTATMHRSFRDLTEALGRAVTHPDGAFLLTGTGAAPDDDYSLAPGDVVTLVSPQVGVLEGTVVPVGSPAPATNDRSAR